jgi:hypothetical protein
MFFQAPTRTPPSRMNTPHCLSRQLVLTELFAVLDIFVVGLLLVQKNAAS